MMKACKEKDFYRSIKLYTFAILIATMYFDSLIIVLRSNILAALFSISDFGSALDAAEKCLQNNPAFFKVAVRYHKKGPRNRKDIKEEGNKSCANEDYEVAKQRYTEVIRCPENDIQSKQDVQSVISTRRVSRDSLVSFRERQFYIIQSDDLSFRRGKKKKKKKRSKLNRLKPATGNNMFSGFRFVSGRFWRSRKVSDSSALSQMSGQSVRISMERNSMETISLQSNILPDTVLPAVTKRDDKIMVGAKGSSKDVPFMDVSPSKKETDFSIFSAKDTGTASLPGELADTQSLARDNSLGLPGAIEEDLTPDPKPGVPPPPHSSASSAGPESKKQRAQTPSCRETPTSKQKPTPKKQPAPSSVSKSKVKSQTLTVQTHQIEEGSIPLHALMADISGGNWGVLLGKSGSSSGSEAGGGASAFMGGLNPYLGSNYPPMPQYGQKAPQYGRSMPQYAHSVPQYNHSMAQYGHNPYHGNMYPSYHQHGGTPYMGVQSMQAGGARPKAKGQWGHFPYFPSGQQVHSNYAGKNNERRMVRERQREREMRRPNQAFYNTTFQIDDADIEYISS